MNNGFYVIEGVCCAGKTSLLRQMEKDGIFMIPESNKMGKQFPPFPTNHDESRRNEKFIFTVEEERSIIGCKNSDKEIRFADRLLPSVLAISFANEVVHGFDSTKEAISDVIEYIKKDENSFSCDAHFYLSVSVDTVLERNRNMEKPLSETWVSEEIIGAQIRFYDLYKEVIKSANFITIDANCCTTEQLKKIILESNPPKVERDKEIIISEFETLIERLDEIK